MRCRLTESVDAGVTDVFVGSATSVIAHLGEHRAHRHIGANAAAEKVQLFENPPPPKRAA